ncbi:hypothetical protein M441DRAFT_135381 [Trichoderma asperellum CBS 433.97]|uniref:PHD-type domain-containing protein n=1 Tax=Trichoderma asperellum (strain ATCC 204424 / CBS 433.97 / NBRC 101777) TaxID=1042311 RepID=A0A2T3ZEM0_TRIA4|nr:hypothetical protein M441DRAFT_135381 [Trichoderma asperellum CBS 433.97]PTB43233.1 hypothetical protein M441DRAFT_135381 [Trichoderma asperellum CBS 433.97]
MISSNTRASRSRFSSPSRSLEAKSSAANDGSKTFMQRWLEPSVQSKASFEEAGLMRYGVLETMAPLGTLPKPKKTGGEAGPGHQPVRKIILRPSGSSHAANHQDDQTAHRTKPRATSPPAPTTPPPPASAPSHRRGQAAKDAEDEEYDPKGAARRRPSRRVSLPAKQARQNASASEGKNVTTVVITPPKPKPVATTPKRAHRREPEDAEFADKVVEAAVDEALMHYRYPTAWALRSLYDERSGDSEFVAMIEDVFKQRADAETMDEFARLIEVKKREGKKDDQGCYYFVPPSTNSRFTPHKPKAAPYARLLLHHADHDKGEVRAAKRSKTSHANDTPHSKKMANGSKSHGDSVRTPSRRRNRRDSGSSESSLSSAMSLSSPEASSSHDAPKSRPITSARRKSLASDKQPVSNSSEPTSPTHPSRTHTSATDASMPGRVSGSELLLSKSTGNSKSVCPKDGGNAAKAQMPADGDDLFWTRRRDAQKATNAYTARESSVRNGDDDEREVTPARRTRRSRQSLVAPVSTRATRSASKRPSSNNVNDDVDIAVSSPLAFSFNEGSSTVGSRAVTPTALRPTKKPRTGLRIKLSPMKKKGGTAAGVPRSTGETPSATTSNGAPRDQGSDNDEYCSACGNTGDVVCCDGCPRSFHFECVDMVQSDHLPDEWYCNECSFRRYPSRVPVYKGVFASALIALEKSIPRAFSLPKKTQTRFEGVKAGADGDYEEVTNNRTKKRAGYDELPDFFKQREDGEAVICHACQKPATEIRAIIPCSACPFHWHIDCLDPPLAMPPVLKTWRCPAHVDDVLGDVPPLAPAHRFRKLKGGQVISPAFSRGNNNNGHIELDWGDELEEPEKSGWRDPDSFGKTYRLQAKGVVLDFIEQLRRRGAGYGPRHDEMRWMPYAGLPMADSGGVLAGSAYDRKVNEMQASLNLLGLKQSRSENIDQLTAALLYTADDNVLALMAKANADNIASGHLVQADKMGLRAMLAQMNAMGDRIRHLLGDEAPPPTSVTHKTNDRGSPVTDTSDVDTFPEKTEPLAPVTEPTPPSTVDHGEVTMELD